MGTESSHRGHDDQAGGEVTSESTQLGFLLLKKLFIFFLNKPHSQIAGSQDQVQEPAAVRVIHICTSESH